MRRNHNSSPAQRWSRLWLVVLEVRLSYIPSIYVRSGTTECDFHTSLKYLQCPLQYLHLCLIERVLLISKLLQRSSASSHSILSRQEAIELWRFYFCSLHFRRPWQLLYRVTIPGTMTNDYRWLTTDFRHSCFHLTSNGGPGGNVGSLSDGQARIGQNLAATRYCIGATGGQLKHPEGLVSCDADMHELDLTDSAGRGCIFTSPTTQFQCDAGASPTTGFSIGCNGTLSFDDGSNFNACPTGDNGGFNLYSAAPSGQEGCVSVSITADGCKPECPAPVVLSISTRLLRRQHHLRSPRHPAVQQTCLVLGR